MWQQQQQQQQPEQNRKKKKRTRNGLRRRPIFNQHSWEKTTRTEQPKTYKHLDN